jgi:regulator of replication initiation timing
MTEDLVQRLRDGEDSRTTRGAMIGEAADEIERLRAELLREHADHAQTVEDAALIAQENTKLRAENEALRIVLQEARTALEVVADEPAGFPATVGAAIGAIDAAMKDGP